MPKFLKILRKLLNKHLNLNKNKILNMAKISKQNQVNKGKTIKKKARAKCKREVSQRPRKKKKWQNLLIKVKGLQKV